MKTINIPYAIMLSFRTTTTVFYLSLNYSLNITAEYQNIKTSC